jgi:hypothetical protein
VISIVAAMDDPGLFEPWFRGASWDGWRAVLRAAFCLPMTAAEVAFFRSVADRNPPPRPVRELWCATGRRSGKDSIASLIAAHAAALFGHGDRLRPGERALVMCLRLPCSATQDDALAALRSWPRHFQKAEHPPLGGVLDATVGKGDDPVRTAVLIGIAVGLDEAEA